MKQFYLHIEKGAVYLFIQFSKQHKDKMISEIQRFFYEERGEEIGLIAAENAYDFFKDQLGPYFYNKALRDARELVEQKMNTLEEDLYALEKNQ